MQGAGVSFCVVDIVGHISNSLVFRSGLAIGRRAPTGGLFQQQRLCELQSSYKVGAHCWEHKVQTSVRTVV